MIIYHYDLMDGVTSELLISISSIVFLIIMTLTYNTEMNYTIFEKEKLNQESNEKEVLFEDIIHSTVEGVMLLDKNFNIIYINKIFSNLLNHEGNIIGKKFFEEYPESPIKEEIYNCRETLNHEFYETSFYLQNKNVILNGWIIPFIEKDKFNGIIITGLDITQDEERQSALKNSIDERNNLLTEVHHRVKNNMQIIISLLNLQSHKIKDQEVKDALFQTQARVRSMALVHENLYKNFDFKDMNIKEYINDLVSEIKGTYITSNNITFETDVVKAFISIDIAVSLGLILNELLTNCIKYAFPNNQEGTVWIKLTTNDDLFKLTVEDNGIGVDNSESTGTGIGSTLINSLVTQIEGTYKIESENGTKVTITFKN
jgi:two-component sensor histidine kinase